MVIKVKFCEQRTIKIGKILCLNIERVNYNNSEHGSEILSWNICA